MGAPLRTLTCINGRPTASTEIGKETQGLETRMLELWQSAAFSSGVPSPSSQTNGVKQGTDGLVSQRSTGDNEMLKVKPTSPPVATVQPPVWVASPLAQVVQPSVCTASPSVQAVQPPVWVASPPVQAAYPLPHTVQELHESSPNVS